MKKAKKNPKNIVLKLSLLGLSYYWVCQDLRSPITCHLHNKLFGKKSFMRASHKMHCLQHNLNSSYNYVLWHVHVWEKRGLHTRKLNRRKVLCKCKNIKKLQIFCIGVQDPSTSVPNCVRLYNRKLSAVILARGRFTKYKLQAC